MSKVRKTLEAVLSGSKDANVRFRDLRTLLLRLGFEERIRGDHYIYSREGMIEIMNLQPKGSLAKPYQVKQVRQLVARHRLEECL